MSWLRLCYNVQFTLKLVCQSASMTTTYVDAKPSFARIILVTPLSGRAITYARGNRRKHGLALVLALTYRGVTQTSDN